MTNPTPTLEQLGALVAFAEAHGRNWKGELNNVYWYNARFWRGTNPDHGRILHEIRNQFGPRWLYDTFKLAEAKRALEAARVEAWLAGRYGNAN